MPQMFYSNWFFLSLVFLFVFFLYSLYFYFFSVKKMQKEKLILSKNKYFCWWK